MTDGEPPGFGEWLRQRRQLAGLTQEELARRAGLSVKSIAALERGRRRRPYPQTVDALAIALGLDDAERAELMGIAPPTSIGSQGPVLPAPPTPMVGRDGAVEGVLGYLRRDSGRLITLTGPGGVGKTRLSLEIARRANADFPDGVFFVSLASLTDSSQVVPAVMASLDRTERVDHPTTDDLAAYLHGRRLLLLLDNFEHVLPAATVVADLLTASLELKVLVTSRSPLRIRGECEYPIAPLALPRLEYLPTCAEVAAADAVQLFVERARASEPTFVLTQENAAAVAAICRRLDGLPLALELAAARMPLLSPNEMLARIEQALPLLAGGARDLPERQRTMQQAIAWSYRLLSGAEQKLFRRLSIFVGGWDAAAAEAIGEGRGLYTLDLLSRLVEHSLVVADSSEGTTRYRMLETIREFGLDQLDASGEMDMVAGAHARWYLKLAEQAASHYYGPGEPDWLDHLERDHPNLRAVVVRAMRDEDDALLLRLVAALGRLWHRREDIGEGVVWMDRALRIARQTPPSSEGATVLFNIGRLTWDRGDTTGGIALLRESLGVWRMLGDDRGVCSAAIVLAEMLRLTGEVAEVELLLRESWTCLDQLGDEPFWLSTAFRLLGIIALEKGDWAVAEPFLVQALDTARESRYQWSIAAALHNLGHLVYLRGDHLRSLALYREALQVSHEQRDRWAIAVTLPALAEVFVSLGEMEQAVRLFGAASSLSEASAARRGAAVPMIDEHGTALSIARRSLGEETYDAAWASGRLLAPESAVDEAARNVELRVQPSVSTTPEEPDCPELSAREMEVLGLVATGMSNAEVAERLYLSRRTVDAHMRRIYDKLNLSSRSDAIRFATEHALA